MWLKWHAPRVNYDAGRETSAPTALRQKPGVHRQVRIVQGPIAIYHMAISRILLRKRMLLAKISSTQPAAPREETLAYIAFISAILVLIRRLGKNLPPSTRQWLLVLLVILPPIGVVFSLLGGSEQRRERVSVSFLGYSIPWANLRSCSLPPDPLARTGVWIGGGDKRQGDIAVDTVALPGYRSHLVELCAVESSKTLSLQARVAGEGLEFKGSAGHDGLKPSGGVHTQRVVLRSSATNENAGDASNLCLALPGGVTISKPDLVKSVQSAWESDRRNAPMTWRRRLRETLHHLPSDEGREVFCMDSSGKRPCQDPLKDSRTATFVWLQKSSPLQGAKWSVLPAVGAEWRACPNGPSKETPTVQIAPSVLGAADWLDETTKGRLPRFSLQMISRRTIGGTADQAVPISVSSMSPSGFHLGPSREFRLATSGSRLFILFDEPVSQIRYDDLFGKGELRAPEGEFTLAFGAPDFGELLAADLSAEADGYTPKPLLEGWKAAIRISSRSSQDYVITAPGVSPESHQFGEIISVPTPFSVKSTDATAPLVLIQRMGTPAGVALVPSLAAIVLLVGIAILMRSLPASSVAWDLSILGVLLLDFRFLLTTRLWMDAPSSAADTQRWLTAGCYPILFAPLIFLGGSVISQWLTKRDFRRSGSTAFSSSSRFPQGTLLGLLTWSGIAVACSLAWLLAGTALTFTDLLRNATTTILDLAQQIVLVMCAGLAAVAGLELVRASGGNRDAGALNTSPLPGGSRRLTGTLRLIGACIACGLLLPGFRLVFFILGWQESLPFGIKMDVLYLPLAAGVIAGVGSALSVIGEGLRFFTISFILLLAFAVAGFFLSDLGLLWVGGMAFVLVLAFEFRRLHPIAAAGLSLCIFLVLFLSPKVFPRPFLFFLQQESSSALREAKTLYPDPLQVRRDRDHYRMMDAVAAEEVRLIPAQLAREVTVERFRIRYQALTGAWREGLRSDQAYGSSWNGAGLLQARPVVGERVFREAARSDYVYQLYVRAEHGTAGLLSLLCIYVTIMLVPLLGHRPSASASSSLAVWALGIVVGSALFMLGGTHGIFPFSGKWTFFMALGSRSDFCLSAALLMLGVGGQYDAK